MAMTRQQLATRLRELRLTLGFTQAQVADALRMHRPTVSEIEAGRRTVTSEELYSFSQLYATSVSTLLSDPAPDIGHVAGVLFRRQGLDTPTARTAVRRFFERCEAERELEEQLGLQHAKSARPGYRAGTPTSKWEAIQQGSQIADGERQRLNIGDEPIRTPLDLLEKQGVRIGPVTALDEDQLDGLYYETAELGPCVGVNPDRDGGMGFRSSFTAAHEYAHWLLQDVKVEAFSFQPGTDDLAEVRANAFAAAFLMPEGGIKELFTRLGLLKNNTIWHLSPSDVVRGMQHFGVSRLALLYRLQNLNLISQKTAEAVREMRVRETAQRLGITFESTKYPGTRLPALAMQAWRRGVISAGRAAELWGLGLEDFLVYVRDMSEQPEGYEGTPLVGAAAEA